ncbi:MAG: TerC/Alx family metal homeostasis membrane protein [Candidatus Pacebacteria bacterium]|nr:TerC/Alx family metal homeostasis membrane protein [Candidatus Paceibacterota bacterium]
MDAQLTLFTLFAVIVVGFMIVDLGFLNRKSHRIEFKEALNQSIFWIAISVFFGLLINQLMGADKAAEFITAYVTEKMLSVDNLFVILLLFNFFKLEEKYHHRVLFWGILGAVLFRAIFILAGAFIVGQFHWVLYIFGAVLFYSGAMLLKGKKEEHVDFEDNKFIKIAKKILPVTDKHHDGKFFLKEHGKWRVTSLFLIVLLVEETDIVFAFDSIPAVFAITQDPFIIFTSNIFAVMGMRSLFFLVESILSRFRHLQKGLALVLLFIGGKMLVGIWDLEISSVTSFAVIILILVGSVLASVIKPRKRKIPIIGLELPF